MSAYEDDGSRVCDFCGYTFDVHEFLSPVCTERQMKGLCPTCGESDDVGHAECDKGEGEEA